MIPALARPAGVPDSRPPLLIQRQPLLPAGRACLKQGRLAALVESAIGRLITIGVVVASLLLIWKSGLLNSVLAQPVPPPLDLGPINSKSGAAMPGPNGVHVSLNGNLV